MMNKKESDRKNKIKRTTKDKDEEGENMPNDIGKEERMRINERQERKKM